MMKKKNPLTKNEDLQALSNYIKRYKIRSHQELRIARDRTLTKLIHTFADHIDPVPVSPHKWQPMPIICQTTVLGPAVAVKLPVIIAKTNPKRTNPGRG